MVWTIVFLIVFSVLTAVVVVHHLLNMAIEDAGARKVFLVVAILTPAMMLAALLRTLYKRPEMKPCPAELLEAENEIEAERVELFGGKRVATFSEAWHASYVRSLQKTIVKVDRMLGHDDGLLRHFVS